MTIIERTELAVAAPGTLVVPEGRILAYAHQILARAYADDSESGEDFESLLIPEHGLGAPNVVVQRSLFYRDVQTNALYLRTNRDPVEYARVGGGSGGDVLAQGTTPYAFYLQRQVSPTLPTLPAAINAGDTLEVPLLPTIVDNQRIYDDRDIVQEWDGALEIEFDQGGVAEMTQRWVVEFASGAEYTQDRTYHFRVASGRPVLVDVDLFSFRQVFRAGTFNIGGSEVTITESDLLNTRQSTATLRIRFFQNDGTTAKATNVDAVSVQSANLTIYQLNALTQPVEDAGKLNFLRDVYRFYTRPGLTVPATISSPTAIAASGDGLLFELLAQEEIMGPIYEGIDFVTQWFGGLILEFDEAGELEVTLLTKHELGENYAKEFTHKRKTVRPVRQNQELHVDLSNFSTISSVTTGTYTPSDGGPSVEITAADLLLPSRITYSLELIVLASRGGARKAINLTYAEFLNPITRSYQVDHAVGTPAVPAIPRPGIAYFEVTSGDTSPDPGSIAGDVYAYSFAASQPGHVMSARIVGFGGTSAANAITPANARTLTTIDADDYALAVGTVHIPEGVSLGAGETYTLRAEVRAEGVLFSDLPTAYGDVPIRALSAASTETAIFFRVPLRVSGARPDSNTLVPNWTIIANRSAVRGTWEVSGIPAEGDQGYDANARWLVGWAVLRGTVDQPTEWSTDGFDITQSIATMFIVDYKGNDYNAYLMNDSGAADDTYNGTMITVGIG